MQTRLDVRRLDPRDEAQLRRFHEIGWRAEKEDGRPWNSFWSYPELAAILREPLADHRREGLCVFDAGRMVGAGLLELPQLDNTDKAYVFAMVEPELRGRGVGGALVDDLLDRARQHGRALAISSATAAAGGGESLARVHLFAEAHGFMLAGNEVYRVLRLPPPDGLLRHLADEVGPHYRGVAIETYVDRLPTAYLASYCHLLNQLVLDAPTGAIDFEAERTTPEIVTQKLARSRRMGRATYVTVAVRDGEVVAHSDLFVLPSSRQAHQMGTLVRQDLRGHRLGTAVKVANLAALLRDRRDVTEVHTQNAETNRWMVDINVRLGFETAGVCPAFLAVL